MSSSNSQSNCELSDGADISFGNEQFSSFNLYQDEWKNLYCKEEMDIELLKQKSIQGKLKTSHFRSICWRCLLGIFHKQPNQWICQLQTYRKHYNEICLEFQHNPRISCNDITFDNPLSQESNSEWQKYFCDEDLKSVILQDVKRTFPDVDYFRNEIIQKIMVRILFCYARQNPTLSYRQGMHEILAPLIFILHCDHQAYLHAKEKKIGIDETISEILNPDYLEQDAFSLFKTIMNHIQCSYRINNSAVRSNDTFSEKDREEPKTYQNEVINRLDFIRKNILHHKDPELSDHLEKLDIPMHLFGIRWLRLLFGREFSLQDLLILWDFIFASNFETVNYIVVAMLVAIRQILLNSNYTSCLSNLMRYPCGVNINYIKELTLHLKDPSKHLVPEAVPILNPAPFQQVENASLTPNPRLKKSSSKTINWLPAKPNFLRIGQIGDGDAITQGLLPEDVSLLKGELDYTKTLIGVTYRKLNEFHSILFANLPKNSSPDIQLVLDGIHELSCLLQNHCKRNNCEIETACEAGEVKNLDEKILKSEETTNKENLKRLPRAASETKKSHTLPKTRRGLKSGELKVFKQEIGGPISKMPMTDPLHLIKDSKNGE